MARSQLHRESTLSEDLGQAMKAAHEAASISRQLLSFSCQESVECRPMIVMETLSQFAYLIHPLLGEQIKLQLKPIDPSLAVRADTTQISQVLMNLCLNARDAMPDGGVITLSATAANLGTEPREPAALEPSLPTDRFVVIRVSDTGRGIPPEARARIFEPFYSTKDGGKGTGLGLTAARAIVEQHGGWIGFDTREGVGTTFSVCLPAWLRQIETSAGSPSPQSAQDDELNPMTSSGNETILIAEDEVGVRLVAQRILQGAGYQTIIAVDGDEAVQQFARHRDRISLVLLDVMMPKRTGHDVFKTIKAEAPDMPVIFCTGYFPKRTDGGLPDSVDATFLGKPFDRNRLLTTVRSVLDRSEQCAVST